MEQISRRSSKFHVKLQDVLVPDNSAGVYLQYTLDITRKSEDVARLQVPILYLQPEQTIKCLKLYFINDQRRPRAISPYHFLPLLTALRNMRAEQFVLEINMNNLFAMTAGEVIKQFTEIFLLREVRLIFSEDTVHSETNLCGIDMEILYLYLNGPNRFCLDTSRIRHLKVEVISKETSLHIIGTPGLISYKSVYNNARITWQQDVMEDLRCLSISYPAFVKNFPNRSFDNKLPNLILLDLFIKQDGLYLDKLPATVKFLIFRVNIKTRIIINAPHIQHMKLCGRAAVYSFTHAPPKDLWTEGIIDTSKMRRDPPLISREWTDFRVLLGDCYVTHEGTWEISRVVSKWPLRVADMLVSMSSRLIEYARGQFFLEEMFLRDYSYRAEILDMLREWLEYQPYRIYFPPDISVIPASMRNFCTNHVTRKELPILWKTGEFYGMPWQFFQDL